MTTPQSFNYEGLFAANAPVTTRAGNRVAKYDFAVAYPDPETLPLDGLLSSLKVALDREGRDLAYYPAPAGLPKLREYVVEKLAQDRDIKTTIDDVALTAGSGEAIAMLIQALTDPGDVLLTEEYVYLGTMRQMRRYGADVRSVRCDSEGIIPEDLETTLKGLADQGKKVKFLYTIPTFQNPMGWTMTLERRRKVLEVARQFGVPILEDDCYVDLRFEGEDVTSFHSLDDTGQVMYVGSFSKIIAPGMRMGYLVAPQPVMQRAMSFKGGGGVNQFAALTIDEFLRHNNNQHIDEHNQALRVKRDAMLAALGENFGGTVKWTKPEGGLYVWLEFPEGTDLASVQDRVFDEGVGYYNGSQFSPEGRGANCARLCYGHPSVQTISDGVTELARLLDSHGVLRG